MKKQTLKSIAFFAFALCLAFTAWGASDEILLDQLGSQHKAVHNQAIQAFLKEGPAAIPVLIGQVGDENLYRDKFAKQIVEKIVNQATAPGAQERIAVEDALIDVVLDGYATDQLNFALWMLSRIGSGRSVPAVAIRLQDDDAFEKARYALERIPCPYACEALLNALKETACPEQQAAILNTLGTRKYEPAVAAICKSLRNPDYQVRLSAIKALGKLSEPQALKTLLAVYAEGYGRMKTAASEALLTMAEGLVCKGETVRARKIYSVLSQEDAPAYLQCAALRGFTKMDGAGAWPKLIVAINGCDPQIRGAARALLSEMQCPLVTAKIANALEFASGDARLELVRLLAGRGDSNAMKAASTLVQYVKEEKEGDLLAAAGKALIQIPGDDVSEKVLYALGGTPKQDVRLIYILGERAYRGAILHLQKLASISYSDSPVPVSANPIASAALEALGKIGDPISAKILSRALQDEFADVRRAAANASVSIAAALQKKGDSQAALDLCLAAMKSASGDALNSLIAILRSLGANQQIAELARIQGFVTKWWIAGPFPNRAALQTSDVIPMQRTDPSKAFKVGDKEYRWQPYLLTNPTGMIDLVRELGNHGNAGAYLYAHVTSDKKQDVIFHIGSDDDFVAYLNGKEVGRHIGDRGWSAGSEKIDVTLNKGLNRILLKVLNGGSEWAASLQVTDKSGTPIRLAQ